MKKTITIFFTLFIIFILPIRSLADPEDSYWLALMYSVQSVNLPSIVNTYQTLMQQKNFLQQALSGNFGYGFLFNDQNALNQRQWSNDNWQDVLNMVSSGNATQFAQAQQAYKNLYPIIDAVKIGQQSHLGQNNLTRTYYQQNSDISRAALAASSYSYNNINQHIQTVHDILAKLENNPDEKAAIDLSARLNAEVSFIQLEMLKQQNFQTQLQATQSQREVNGLSDASNFMSWQYHY